MSHVALVVPSLKLRSTVVPVRNDDFSRTSLGQIGLGTPSDGLAAWETSQLEVLVSGQATGGFSTTAFADSFNRADGAVGNGWTAVSGFTISGDKVVSSGSSAMAQAISIDNPNLALLSHLHLQNTGTGSTRVQFPTGAYVTITSAGSVQLYSTSGTVIGSAVNLVGSLATGLDLLFLIASSGVQVFEGLLPTASAMRLNLATDRSLVDVTSPYSFTLYSTDSGQTITYFDVKIADLSSTDRLFAPAGTPATAAQVDYNFGSGLGSLSMYVGNVAQVNPQGAVGVTVNVSGYYSLTITPTWSSTINIASQPYNGTLRAAIERGNFNVYVNNNLIASIGNCPFTSFDQVGLNLNDAMNYGYTPGGCYLSNFFMYGPDTTFVDTFEDAF